MQIKTKKIIVLISISFLIFLFFLHTWSVNTASNEKQKSNVTTNDFLDPSLNFSSGMGESPGQINEINGGFSVNIEDVIEDYTEWAKYPPDSRPLLKSHEDVLNPKVITVATQSMPISEKGVLKNSGYSCSLQPEFHSVTEGKTLRIFLACYLSGTDKKQKLNIDSAILEGRAGKNKFTPPQISGNDSGSDGDATPRDLVYTFHFRPRLSDWGDMNFTVLFHIIGDQSNQVHSLTHHFFSSPVAPAYFTGKFSDRVEDGSLFIEIELQVNEPGRYTIEANLMTENEEPIGYARKDEKLNSGKQKVTLLYFGKIISASRESGPYKLTYVRGTLNTDVIQEEMLTKSPAEVDRILSKISDDRPKHKTVPYYEAEYKTGNYALNLFSDKEYDSAEKRQRIEELKMLRK